MAVAADLHRDSLILYTAFSKNGAENGEADSPMNCVYSFVL